MTDKTRARLALIGVATGTLTALATGVGAQPASADSAATRAPFKAHYAGSFTATSTGFSVSGSGNATLLGMTENNGTVVMQPQANPACPSTGFVVTNDEVLTAANGDQVVLTILDMPCPVPGQPGIYDGVSTYHITGGTGRFAGANGHGSFDGRGNFNNPDDLTFTYTFSGTISVPNNN